MANLTTTGDIGPMSAVFAVANMLFRATPYLVFEKFGQTVVLPKNNSTTIKFRRFEHLDATPNTITEGVTPPAKIVDTTDVTATLDQYGDRVIITDVVLDTTDCPVLKENTAVLGEQAAEMIENVRFGILKAGTNVYYANGSARSDVNEVMNRNLQRKVTRFLKAQKARMITKIVRSTPSYATQNVAPAYVAVCHPNCEADIRDMQGFVDAKDYGTMSPWENEIGACEQVRYVYSTVVTPWEDAGGDASTGTVPVLSTTGTNADVYPILFIARDAYGIVPLKGETSITPMVVNPKPTDSDPMAQRGHVAWKSMQTCVILNQSWICRAEVAVSA